MRTSNRQQDANARERQIDEQYRREVQEAASKVVKAELPREIEAFERALEKYQNQGGIIESHREQARELLEISGKVKALASADDESLALSAAQLARQLKVLGCSEEARQVTDLILAESDALALEVSRAVSAIKFAADEQREKAVNIVKELKEVVLRAIEEQIFTRPENKKSGIFEALENRIADLKYAINQSDISYIQEKVTSVRQEIDELKDSFKSGVSADTPLVVLKRLVEVNGGALPAYPADPHQRLTPEGKSDLVLMEQYIFTDAQYRAANADTGVFAGENADTWRDVVVEEVNSWDTTKFLAAVKTFIAANSQDARALDHVEGLVKARFGLHDDMLRLAQSLYDREISRQEIAICTLEKRKLEGALTRVDELTGKSRIRRSVKYEFADLIKDHIGSEVKANIVADIEAGRWLKAPKEHMLLPLQQAIAAKIEQLELRIEEIRTIRSRQFTCEEVLEAYLLSRAGEINQELLGNTIATLFAAGIFKENQASRFSLEQQLRKLLDKRSRSVDLDESEQSSSEAHNEQNLLSESALQDDKETIADQDAAWRELVKSELVQQYGLTEDSLDAEEVDIIHLYEGILEPLRRKIKAIFSEDFAEQLVKESAPGLVGLTDPNKLEDIINLLAKIRDEMEVDPSLSEEARVEQLRSAGLIPLVTSAEYLRKLEKFQKSLTNKASAVAEAQEEQGSENSQPTDGSGVTMEQRLQGIIEKHQDAVCREEHCNASNVESIAEVVHYGWHWAGQTHPVLDLDKIKDNAKMIPKTAKKVLKQLMGGGVVFKDHTGYGLNHPDNFTCSPELKNFVQEIRELRKPQR